MDSLAGRQLMPHSLSDVMHQTEPIFNHTGTFSYFSVSTQGCRSAAKLTVYYISSVQFGVAAFH